MTLLPCGLMSPQLPEQSAIFTTKFFEELEISKEGLCFFSW
jgi:hypothetical protein